MMVYYEEIKLDEHQMEDFSRPIILALTSQSFDAVSKSSVFLVGVYILQSRYNLPDSFARVGSMAHFSTV